jgi:hypothetical protein
MLGILDFRNKSDHMLIALEQADHLAASAEFLKKPFEFDHRLLR